jgi:hypothetical protein
MNQEKIIQAQQDIAIIRKLLESRPDNFANEIADKSAIDNSLACLWDFVRLVERESGTDNRSYEQKILDVELPKKQVQIDITTD